MCGTNGLMDRSNFVEAMGHQDGDYRLRCGVSKPLVAKKKFKVSTSWSYHGGS